jgi:hypothetical protein
MDSNVGWNGWLSFLELFDWKKPFFYFTLGIAICTSIYIFCLRSEYEPFGIMEQTKGLKVLFTFFVSTVFSALFCQSSSFMEKIDSIFIRCLILTIAGIFVTIFISYSMWTFSTYNNQKMNTYTRILPLKKSPYFQRLPTLEFNTIKAIKRYGISGDPMGGVGFLLENDTFRGFGFANIETTQKALFIFTLYDNCEWLRDDIEDIFSYILVDRDVYESKKARNIHMDIQWTVIFLPFIWVFFMEVLFVIMYTFKMLS